MSLRHTLITLGCLFGLQGAWAAPILSGSATDPSGDATSACCDLVFASAVVDSTGTLALSVRFAPGTFDASVAMAAFNFDTDENVATGHPGVAASGTIDNTLLGVDYLVWVGGQSANHSAQVRQFVSFNNFVLIDTAPATVLADGFDVLLGPGFFDDDNGKMNFKVTSAECVDPDTGPACGNFGIADILTDEGLPPVHVPEPATLALLGAALAGLGYSRRRKLR